jgi:hypothetical protein
VVKPVPTALHWALERGVTCGGWRPKGRKAEDGVIEAKYPLKESSSSSYLQRTEWNVRDSDAILIIADREGLSVSKGTKRAQERADHYGKPLLVIDVSQPDAAAQVAQWLRMQRKRFGAHLTLGVGGPRESEAPGIYATTRLMMDNVLDHGSSQAAGAGEL